MLDIAFRIASQFAPGLVRRLGGERAGDIAETLFGLGRQVLGNPSLTPEEIAQQLERDTEKAHEFRMLAAREDARLEQAYLEDRQDARNMRLELARMGKTDWMMYAVGVIVTLGLVAVTMTIFFVPELSERQAALLQVLSGGLLAGFMSVVGYFFGSSRGSKEKSTQMALLRGGNNERE